MHPLFLALAPIRAALAAPRRRPAGFSLVEVTLAIGIVAAVFIPLIGMLPVALTSYRSAMDATLRANMSRQVSAQLAQAPFDQINQPRDFYFDDQGVLLKDKTGARFQVNCTAKEMDREMFGGAAPTPSTMKKVKMEMTSLLGTGTRFSLATTNAVIADNGIRTPTPAP